MQINLGTLKIRSFKWHPHAVNHLAILTNDNRLHIYDLNETIDDPVKILNLNYGKKDKNCDFVDFSFSSVKYFYDFSFLAIFFMNRSGKIYYQCPVLWNKLCFDKSAIELLRIKLEKDKGLKLLDDTEFTKNLELIDHIERISEEDKGKLFLRISPLEHTQYFNNQEIMQGFV